MEKGKLFFLIAPPRAGKTTFCKEWVSKPDITVTGEPIDNTSFPMFTCEKLNFTVSKPRVIISGDEFRKAVHGHSYIKEAEELVFANMTTACRALINSGFDVLVDETNSTLTSIYRLLLVDIDAQAIWLDTPEDVCIERAIKTEKPYLVLPIKRICSQIRELKANWPNNFNIMRQQIIDRKTSDQVAI